MRFSEPDVPTQVRSWEKKVEVGLLALELAFGEGVTNALYYE